ncbi:Hypothetical predicted protein [Cloeon dipterum]|uniref:Reverse transcriptase domain-containing protein n=1 Tax=Cloeon dipterum TaxID=197152 RepID=A0A8S1CGS0_9INSE|nr:Hypothetical predicted protein [Cloeon dipterum]
MKSKITKRTAVLVTIVCATRLQLLIFDLRIDPLHPPTPPHRWTPEFTTSEVNTRCVLPLWTTLDAGRIQAHKNRLLIAPASSKVSPVKRALWHLLLCLALSGQIELNPGPLVNCFLCDRPGRRTQIRIKCGVCEKCDSLAFAQLIKRATRTTATTEKIIDLFLSDTPTLVSSSEVTAGVSDHDALLVHLKMDSRRPTPISTTVPDWQRANWPMLNELLEVRLQAVQAKEDLFTAWDEWKTILFECVANCVPNRRQRSKKRLLPWLDKGLKKMIKIKNSLFKIWQEEKTDEAKALFQVARKATQGAIRLAKDRWLWALGRGPGGAAVFWKYIHSKSKVPINTASFSAGGQIFTEPRAIASQFLASFKENFSPASLDFPFLRRAPVQEPKLSQWRISVGDVENQLKTLNIKSATGPDGIPAVLLKNCASTLCPSFAHIFQLSILASDLPMDWKNAAVTPVPKEGEKTNFKNYRPISVTSIVGKLLEKHVRNQLAAFLEQTEALPDGQHGFRSRRSCTTMLLRTLDSWTVALDSQSGARIHAVFLDWSKAFD